MSVRSLFFVYIFVLVFSTPFIVYADTAEELKNKIDERTNQIQQLEKQIQEYNTQVDQVGKEAKTLQSTIKSLDLTQKRLQTDLTLTDRKLSKTTLTIEQLTNEIGTAMDHIDTNKEAIAYNIRMSDALEQKGVFELILSGKNLTEIWNDIENIRTIQKHIKEKTDALHVETNVLTSKQVELQDQKKKLTGYKQDLAGQKQAIEVTKSEKANILVQTKNKEQAYKKLIEVTAAQKAQFEREVFDYESQLKLAIDPTKYPEGQHGILSWPLDTVRVTQLFGKTVGAEKLYVSGSHNGVDFGAKVGTRVKNVLSGTVVGTGNTDMYSGCYSFGKWVMVRHNNGLSTIYGHLSVISVVQGQVLGTGDLIGYSGNTGYSTGPHLHISVYATQGVRIEQFVNSRGCKQAIIPLADIKAYLDPMLYFPAQ